MERREVGWLAIVGTGMPFCIGLVFGPKLISPALAGPNGNQISLITILAVGVAVTSVAVVSRIFADLKILHTRFARIVLGVAVLEDIVLWLALAIATALAGSTMLNSRQLALHLGTTIGFFGLALTVVPRIIKRLNTPLQRVRPAVSCWLRDRGPACLLRGRGRTERKSRLRRVPDWLRGGPQKATSVLRMPSKRSRRFRSHSLSLFTSRSSD